MLRPYSAPEAAKLLPTVARLKNAQKRRARPYKHAGIGCARKRRTLSIPRSGRPRVQRPAGTRLTRRPRSERIRAVAEGARGLVVVVCVDRSEPAVELIHPSSAMRPWAADSGAVRATDGGGTGHGRGRERPRTGPVGAVSLTAPTRIPT